MLTFIYGGKVHSFKKDLSIYLVYSERDIPFHHIDSIITIYCNALHIEPSNKELLFPVKLYCSLFMKNEAGYLNIQKLWNIALAENVIKQERLSGNIK